MRSSPNTSLTGGEGTPSCRSPTCCGIFLRAWPHVIAHWRAIIALLILVPAALLVIRLLELNLFFELIGFALLLIFVASQLFWIGRVLDLGQRFIPGKPRRKWLAVIAGLIYLFFFGYWLSSGLPGHHARAADLLVVGAFAWWLVGSVPAFALVIAFRMGERAASATAWAYRKARQAAPGHAPAPQPTAVALDPPSPARRRFLEQTAVLVSATPFVAVGYGLLYERLDVEVVRQRIRLARLPKAFEGFRIAQLSDMHISPFTTAGYIRRCVAMTNGLKPDLVVLTGDYVDWNAAPQREVVEALAGLRAPYGVFGCLGNHEAITEVEESITRLFAAQGIRILRQERAPIRVGGEKINLIGMDSPVGRNEEEARAKSNRCWQQVKGLVMPETVNILLVHFPFVFGRAAELGIDLTLAGHTHGGQLSLDFLHRGLNFSALETPYVSGWYEKRGAQLYVNRGIGTINPNIRLGAPPEITVLELTRAQSWPLGDSARGGRVDLLDLSDSKSHGLSVFKCRSCSNFPEHPCRHQQQLATRLDR